MAPLIGIDVSHHQGAVNWPAMFRDGVRFAGLKATEGDSLVDSRFASNLKQSRAAGVLPFAYHYQRAVASAAEQVSHIARVVPKDCPVALDVEAGSGPVSVTRAIRAGLVGRGYHVSLSYIPRWYWLGVGQPSLVGLPPLWSSRYPDNVIHDINVEYAEVARFYPHFWEGYGGLTVAILQFTSSARVGGRAPIDGNAYRGSLAQLRTLLTGAHPVPPEEGGFLADLTQAEQEEVLNKIRELRLILDGLPEWVSSDDRWVAKTLSAIRNNDVGVPTNGLSVHERLDKVESGLAAIAATLGAIATKVGV